MSVEEMYRKQRDKMSADLRKFIRDAVQLAQIFGSLRIRRWVFLVPTFDSRRLIAHAATKAAEVRAAGLAYAHEDFQVIVTTDAAFPVERQDIAAIGLYEVRVVIPPVQPTEVEAWTQIELHSELIGNMDRKAAKLPPLHDTQRRAAFVNSMLLAYLHGQALLAHLHDHYPEIYQRVIALKRARGQLLQMHSLAGENPSSLGAQADEFRAELGKVRGISSADVVTLVQESLADWLMLCPLDFQVSH